MDKKGTLIIFLASAIVGALLALIYFFLLSDKPKSDDTVIKPAGIEKPEDSKKSIPKDTRTRNPELKIDDTLIKPQSKYDLSRINENPEAIARAIAKLAENPDMDLLKAMVSERLIPAEVAAVIEKALKDGGYKLDPNNPVSEVGEIQRAKKVRWALNLEGGRRILVDIEKDEVTGKWKVAQIFLPSDGSANSNDVFVPEAHDPLGIIDAFMRATISQRFDVARRFIDSEKVTDATIAGICILFEEGHYNLRKKMPLRNMFQTRNDKGEMVKTSFLAYIQSKDGKEAGNIGIIMDRKEDASWLITNITLDSLLNDYANNFGGGDAFYTPLVKNPKGGESLVLYFGFDEAVLTPRSVRQLEIVARILKLDAGKKIEISGHTDDLGSDKYNQVLSEARAGAVRQALIDSGLPSDQVVTKGFGKQRQRRVVPAEDSEKDAEAIRRANRRAEIYLDF